MTKPAGKASAPQPITLKGEGATPEGQAEAVAVQKAWAYRIAAGIERGELPTAGHERRMLAAILRHAADESHVPTVRKRGNPAFVRKLPDDDTVPLMVGELIARGATVDDAVHSVALDFGADDNTVLKLFRARRDAVADDFLHGNLSHRVGAIRGE